MSGRYYYNDDRLYSEFAGWAIGLTGLGLSALGKLFTKSTAMYRPISPDDTRDLSQFEGLLGSYRIDWSKAKLPKFSLDNEKPPMTWDKDSRPQIVKQDLGESFIFPRSFGKPVSYTINVPKSPFDGQSGIGLMSALASVAPRLSYEIIAENNLILWQIVDYEGTHTQTKIVDAIKTHLPDAVVTVGDPLIEMPREYPFHRQLLTFGLANEYPAPLPSLIDFKDTDPFLPLINRMSRLQAANEERVKYQLLVFAPSVEAINRGGARLVEGSVTPSSGIYQPENPLRAFDERRINAKLEGPLYICFLAVTVESRDERRLDELAAIAHELGQFGLPRHNRVQIKGAQQMRREIPTSAHAAIPWFEGALTGLIQSKADWYQLMLMLSAPEMAGLWHLPDERHSAAGVMWAKAQAPAEVTGNADGRIHLADVFHLGQRQAVTITAADRSYHHYIAGKTGMGKSTLMHNLIHQDIAAGHSVAVIDPHGQLTDAILARSIPDERRADVVLLLGNNPDAPIPLNPLRVPPGATHESAFAMIYWTMRKIYENIWREGQMDITMRHVLSALLTDPDATPLDIERLFSEPAYRKKLVTAMTEREDTSFATLQFWQRFGKQSEAEHRELARPILNRTSAFLGNGQLELMTCHPNTLDFSQFIREKKIVLINLAGDAIKSEVGSLGAILMSAFFLASESLGYQAGNLPPRLYLYVDELEKFVTSPLDDILSQARKFGLSVTLANQFLGQMASGTLESILGNVGNQFIFEVGDKDVSTFAPVTEPDVPRAQLLNLGAHNMAVKTRAGGKTLPAFVAKTRPMPHPVGQPMTIADAPPIDGLLPRREVRAWLNKRYAPEEEPEKPSKRKPPAKRSSKDGLGDYE